MKKAEYSSQSALRKIFILSLVFPILSGAAELNVQYHVKTSSGKVGVTVISMENRKIGGSIRLASELGLGPGPSVRDLKNAGGGPYRASANDTLIINGGYSNDSPDRPDGLLLSNSRVISAPLYLKFRTEKDGRCSMKASARYKLDGIVCLRADRVSVGAFSENGWQTCTNAVQVGPLLVNESVALETCRSEGGDEAFIRSAICTSRINSASGYVHVAITEGPVSLLDFSRFLASSESDGGIACNEAVNLPGDASAGVLAILRPDPGSPVRRKLLFGEASFPQSSVIVLVDNN